MSFELLWCVNVLAKKNSLLTLVSEADSRGGYVCAVAGSIWEISVPPSQLCCKPKTGLKKL